MKTLNIQPAGDRALYVSFGQEISEEVNRQVIELSHFLRSRNQPAIKEIIPATNSLLIRYDPESIGYTDMRLLLDSLVSLTPIHFESARKVLDLPICFEKAYGPDVSFIAENGNMSSEQAIDLFIKRDYRVYMFGGEPGYGSALGLDPALETPRRAISHDHIPAGSIGIRGKELGVFALPITGDWRIIGRTPLQLFQPDQEEVILFEAGDYLHFEPITEKEYTSIKSMVDAGTYKPQWIRKEGTWDFES